MTRCKYVKTYDKTMCCLLLSTVKSFSLIHHFPLFSKHSTKVCTLLCSFWGFFCIIFSLKHNYLGLWDINLQIHPWNHQSSAYKLWFKMYLTCFCLFIIRACFFFFPNEKRAVRVDRIIMRRKKKKKRRRRLKLVVFFKIRCFVIYIVIINAVVIWDRVPILFKLHKLT